MNGLSALIEKLLFDFCGKDREDIEPEAGNA